MCLFQSSKKVHCLSCTFVSSSAWSMISFCPFLYWLEDMSPYSAHIFYSNYIFLGLYFLDCESLCIWILFQPFLNSVFFFLPLIILFLFVSFCSCCISFHSIITLFWDRFQWGYIHYVPCFSFLAAGFLPPTTFFCGLLSPKERYQITSHNFLVNNFPGTVDSSLYTRYMFLFVLHPQIMHFEYEDSDFSVKELQGKETPTLIFKGNSYSRIKMSFK